MENIAVSIQNLTKSYKLYNAPFDRVKEAFSFSHKIYSTEKCVLNHVNVDIKKGEVVQLHLTSRMPEREICLIWDKNRPKSIAVRKLMNALQTANM